MSRTQRKRAVLAHLIVGDSLSKSFDEPRRLFGTTRLIYEPGRRAFFQRFQRLLLNIFQHAATTVDKGGRSEQLASAPGQLRPSRRLLRVLIDHRCGDVLFEPV